MATHPPILNKTQLAANIRLRLVDEVVQSLTELVELIDAQLTTLLKDAVAASDQQLLRETWVLYQSQKHLWVEGTAKACRAALKPEAPRSTGLSLNTTLELVSTETVENQIFASRIALAVMEVAANEVNDLRKRLKSLNPQQELSAQDVVHPEVLALAMVEQWVECGFSLDAWQLINAVVQHHINFQWRQIYARCNAALVEQGVMPVIAPEARAQPKSVARAYDSAEQAAMRTQGATAFPTQGATPFPNQVAPAFFNQGSSAFPNQGAPAFFNQGAPAMSSRGAPGWPSLAGAGSPQGGASEVGVLDRVGRMMTGLAPVQSFPEAFQYAPSPGLMSALVQRPLPAEVWGDGGVEQPLPELLLQRVSQMAGDLRQQSVELKKLAQNDNEKALIELVTLMFQSILQEDRIPPGIRVWFARLQMPVLSLALTNPDFFNRQDHPARLLIDHMGSCVLGFNASDINSDDLAAEIKRVVQVIEQYPDVGERVYQRVYEEFKEFLKGFLTQKSTTQKVVGVAQQVEQKETLAIQCTIELRNQIKEMPVRDDIRDFLYKIWSEAIAVASMRHGGQHETTMALKKTATDLIWAASAKPNRADRARVIADLPGLLQSLRYGMGLLSLSGEIQDGHIKVISDILADAFMSKTPAIDMEQIQALAERLDHLEDYFSNDGAEELPLDVQSIEDLLGIDASDLEVVTSGGAEANPVMMAWSQNLSLGAWFTLEFLSQSFQVQYVWRSPLGHLHLFSSVVARSYLIQTARLAGYLQNGLLRPQEEVSLMVRATRDAMAKLEANPARLLE